MPTEDASKLFVAGLPDGITEDALRALFTEAGSQVEQLSLPRDRATGRPRGFAFVTLGSPEQAEQARGRLDGTLVDGRSITVRPFSSEPPQRRGPGDGPGPRGPGGGGGGGGGRFQDTSDRTLYVGNLPYDASETEVRELFSTAGSATPQRIHLPTDPTGRPRGFGFVTFATPEEANAAIVQTRDAAVRGRRCVIHIAHKKGERPPPREGGGFGGGGPRPRGPDMAEVWLATQGGGERRRPKAWTAGEEGSTEGGGPGAPGNRPPGGGYSGQKKRRGGEGERGGGRPKPKQRGGGGAGSRWGDDDD